MMEVIEETLFDINGLVHEKMQDRGIILEPLPQKGDSKYYFEGLPVYDIKDFDIGFSLIKSDIVNSVACDSKRCVWRNALMRFKNIEDARVGNGKVYLKFKNQSDRWYRAQLDNPTNAKRKAFDKASGTLHDIADWVVGTKGKIIPVPKSGEIGARSGKAQGSKTRTGTTITVRSKPTRPPLG